MGAWGHGHFENDAALDFLSEIEQAKYPKTEMAQILEATVDEEYLDSDISCAALIAATCVDAQLNGTKYEGLSNLSLDTDLSDLKGKAVQALERILGEESELNDLWKENEEAYPLWRNEVEQLIERLAK